MELSLCSSSVNTKWTV